MPSFTLGEIAGWIGGRVVGDAGLVIEGINSLEGANERELSFLYDERFRPEAGRSRAAAIVARFSEGFSKPILVVNDVKAALARIAERFVPQRPARDAGIHPASVIAADVTVGEGTAIGPFTVVEEGVRIGPRCRISERCSLGAGSMVGDDVTLHPGVTIYPGTRIGNRVEIHSGAVIGVDGFSIAIGERLPQKVPSLGWVDLEDDVEVFANVTIARAAFGETRIGRGTKVDCLSHVAHNCVVGPGCVFAAYAKLSGSVEVGEGVIFGGDVGVVDHIRIGSRVRVGASSALHESVEEGAELWGRPARPLKTELRLQAILRRLPDVWRAISRFAKGEGGAGA